jgi:hypothetical protein
MAVRGRSTIDLDLMHLDKSGLHGFAAGSHVGHEHGNKGPELDNCRNYS